MLGELNVGGANNDYKSDNGENTVHDSTTRILVFRRPRIGKELVLAYYSTIR